MDVHYDTYQDGLNGWQSFSFEEKITARYIRLHAINDSKARSFHIIEFQIFDFKPNNTDISITLDRTFSKTDVSLKTIEIGDGTTISNKIHGLIKTIEKLNKKYSDSINTNILNQAKSELESRVFDIARIEKEASSIRREILHPISSRMRTSNILQYVSIVFGVIGIISFVLQMTGCI